MKHTFQFRLLGSKVHMFSEEQMGIVIEKEPDVVCVYGTDDTHQNILCAIPLCPPKFLKGAEYVVDFCTKTCAKVSVGNLHIVIDFEKKKCATNKNLKCYGSDIWGEDAQAEWSEIQ